jgi:hypothetical protein
MPVPPISRAVVVGLLAAIAVIAAGAAEPPEELAQIRQQVAEARRKLGDHAGVPESQPGDKYLPVPKDGRWLTLAEAKPAFARALPKLERLRWWKVGLDPTTLTHALREPAGVIGGCVAAARAGLDDADRALALARDAAEFLIWAQAEAGTGVYPFPAVRGQTQDRAFAAANRFLAEAERQGRLGEFVHRGWTIADATDGGLQFDNGEAGVAMLELYEITHEPKYLASARKSADWAAAHANVRNWNYNSFSVYLLAKFFAVTGERPYLAAATAKARLGVIPGQLTDGPHAGRWVDPHNARPAYHYIMMRALAQLAAVLPENDPAAAEVRACLHLGLRARNAEFLTLGVPNKDKAMEALLLVHRLFAGDAKFLRETKSTAALDALGKLVSEQYRRGSDPLGPREWPMFLAYVTQLDAAPKRP